MRVSVLMRVRNMISMKVKLRIYKATILPYLTYCSLVWHFCRGSDRRKLEKVNERGYIATGDHLMMSYSRVHGCLVFTIGACRISQSSCAKWNLSIFLVYHYLVITYEIQTSLFLGSILWNMANTLLETLDDFYGPNFLKRTGTWPHYRLSNNYSEERPFKSHSWEQMFKL